MEEVSKTGSIQLSLFKAETEEELEKIKGMEVPVMSQAINACYSLELFLPRFALFDLFCAFWISVVL